MITTVLAAGGRRPIEAVLAPALQLADGLSGHSVIEVVTPDDPDRAVGAVVSGSDLVVVASGVRNGVVDPWLRALLHRFGSDRRWVGVVTFALTVGDWPMDAAVVNAQLRPAVQAAGGTCLAPGLHVGGPGSDRALASYVRFWAPALPALTGSRRAIAEPAA